MSIERVVKEYVEVNKLTDKLSPSQLSAVHMGLFGEVGSLMAAVKKRYRERAVYLGYPTAIEEELGDILWYLTALGRRLGIDMAAILASGGDGLTASADEEGSKGKERAGIADPRHRRLAAGVRYYRHSPRWSFGFNPRPNCDVLERVLTAVGTFRREPA